MLSKNDTPMANQLQANSQGYLNQGMQAPTPTLLNQGSQVPASQQDFASPGTLLPVNPPAYTGGLTYVPGVGMLGADLGGAVQGTMLRQQYQNNAAENNRAEETLGLAKTKMAQDQDYLNIAKEQLGIQLDSASQTSKTFEQQQAIQQGMQSAAQQGGFSGVIDYLKVADPNMALNFQAKKIQADDMIRRNEVAQASQPNEMTKVMFDAYAMGGKMSAALMNAPESARPQIYSMMQPAIQKLFPGAPKEYGPEAQSLGMLMMAQGTPENQLYASSQLGEYAKTDMGKLNISRQQLLNKNGNNVNDPKIQQMDNEIAALDANHQKTALLGNNAQLDITNKRMEGLDKQVQMNMNFSRNLQQASRPFVDKMTQNAQVYNLASFIQDQYKKGGDTSMAQGQLAMSQASLANGGRPSDKDYANVQAAAGWMSISKTVQSWFMGEKVHLKPFEVNQAMEIQKYMTNQEYQKQLIREGQWKQNADSYSYQDENGNSIHPINWDTLPKPSKDYQALIDPSSKAQLQSSQSKSVIDQQASEAYNSPQYFSGMITGQQIEAKRQELYKQAGQGTDQNFTHSSLGGTTMPNGQAISKMGIGG